MTRTRLRALQGTVFGTASALGWVLLECAIGLQPVTEVLHQPLLYAYLLLGALSGFAIFGGLLGRSEDRLAELNARLADLAVTDALTGLKNVRYFRARMAEAEAAARRSGEPLSLLVIDLDRFKEVNDRFGHDTGDAVLCEAAHAIASVVRGGDTAARVDGAVARMGGEEFAILLPGSNEGEAAAVGERVLRAVRQCAVPAGAAEVRITASAGVASLARGGGAAPGLYTRADQAMYAAKVAGRDRVVTWPEEPAARAPHRRQPAAA
jgi:diguanylate cyclase (GGDEF)-like protein